ncbi:amino acid ABC transporter substrate-binding protein [Cytobacillus sp. IB215665]|uniref:amino acid ABC transporter substrate-binding protein n=1 Tax=Cytobacillus sp. IB215665 TaxID=3097357 RepID=UPI002A1367F6|nr:amino acid ABC transporter substrate-binding protein [Cytobacillus sp. IB215665]MDX8365776.1 amino acid ABC transporter substrate-binding protein [Cytobacillus sp. IB215665]
MKKRFGIFTVFLLLLVVAISGCSDDASSEESKSLLDTVKDRGKLIAGVNGSLPGFGYVGTDGEYTGFDVDFAKAIAVAVLGDANAIEYRPLTSDERFTAVQSGEVDVLVRNTTWTTNRDSEVGLNFAPVTFYDGQGIIVRKDSGINSLQDLEGARISVDQGTTTELNLADVLDSLGIKYEAAVFDTQDAAVQAYEEGSVDAWTTDKSGLIARQANMENPSDHKILDETLSKEPLGPSVIGGDDTWFDIVKWVTFATMRAEELGITSENVDEMLNSDNKEIQRLLGQDGNLGEQLHLDNDFAYKVIKEVGNYGEIFERNLGSVFGLERGLNDTYLNGGLMYSPPFR